MSSFPEKSARAVLLLAALCALAGLAQGGERYPGIGRAATPQEVAAWDIDVRPDFQGLPAGAGTVVRGQQVWEDKCASCHGIFGESNSVFSPLVGGTTTEDIRTGRVASLTRPDYPGRTTLMKLSSLSTLWDYINRAMPWAQPKSLSVEEVYAVTAYLLHLGGVVPENFTLSDANIREVQQRLPNRNGMTTHHALWPGKELGGTARPDVAAKACMSNCAPPPGLKSSLPDHARDAHGNLAAQNRLVGAQRGAVTAPLGAAGVADAADKSGTAQALAQKHHCTACHAATAKLVGPSWADIAQKHGGKAAMLADKIRSGGAGVWGAVPMPPQSLGENDARSIAQWLASGAAP